MSRALRLGVGMSLLLLWLIPVIDLLALPWVVVGPSMAPTLLDGERVLVDRWTYGRRAPRPGEIVLLVAPDGRRLIKRVGTAPDRARGGGAVWVVGDNRRVSDDSRRFGPVSPAAVRGRVVLRYWPPSRVGAPAGRAPATLPAR